MKHLCIFWLMLLISTKCLSAEVYVKLLPQALVDHISIRLGDIANIVTDDLIEREKLLREPVAEIKNFAIPFRLTQSQLERTLFNNVPELKGRLIWGGATSTSIEGKKHLVSLVQGMSLATDWIVERNGSEVECILLSKPELIEVPIGFMEQQPLFEQARWMGNIVSMPLSISVDGVFITKRMLRFKVRFTSTKTDTSTSGLTQGSKVDQGESLVIPRGEENSQRTESKDSFRQLLIKKNQRVRVVIENGAISIESQGIAQANAYVGDVVAIKRIDSPDIFEGKAVDQGVVIVKD